MANALAGLFGYGDKPRATAVPVGSGAANEGRDTADAYSRYKRYATEAQMNGETPKPFEEWKALNG